MILVYESLVRAVFCREGQAGAWLDILSSLACSGRVVPRVQIRGLRVGSLGMD
jgi:hypothetical protein